jgi:hypothetical protein
MIIAIDDLEMAWMEVAIAISGDNLPFTWKGTLETEQSFFGPRFEIEILQIRNIVLITQLRCLIILSTSVSTGSWLRSLSISYRRVPK